MKGKKKVLGRGLNALLGKDYEKGVLEDQVSLSKFNEIEINNISPNPFQPRKKFNNKAINELATSIKSQGIIQPITVRRISNNKYQLITGERRIRASKIAGINNIPAYIIKVNKEKMLEMGIIENIQREDLNSIEIATSYKRLIDECNISQEDLGGRLGKDRSTINNYLRLLKLPPFIQNGLIDNKISMGHARTLITINNLESQLAIYKKIISDKLSVRQVETLVKKINSIKEKISIDRKSNELIKMESKLSSYFGTKVLINNNQRQIIIRFESINDLNRIIDLL